MKAVRRLLGVMVCTSLLSLGACGDGDKETDPKRSPSPKASQSTSQSPTPTASPTPTMLPEDLPADEVKPEDFVRAWFDAYNELTLTGADERFRALSAPECATCESILKAYSELYAAGGTSVTEGPPNTVSKISPEKSLTPPKGVTRLRVDFQTSAGSTQQQPGAESEPFAAESYTWVFDLMVQDNKWRIIQVAG